MRRLLSLLLIVGLVAGLLPACTDAEASTDYVPGAAARRSRAGGVEYEAPTDHYYDFEDPNDYFDQANVDALEADNYTVVAVVDPENLAAAAQYWCGHWTDATQADWGGQLVLQGTVQIRSWWGENACNNTDNLLLNTTVNDLNQQLVAFTFDYSGNPGVFDSTMKNYWISVANGTKTNTDGGAKGPVVDCTAILYIAKSGGLGSFDGKIYWWAYYASVLTQGNLEDLFDGTLHPATDFTPVMYVDFSKAVAGTYAPEVGAAYVFTVNGAPVQGP